MPEDELDWAQRGGAAHHGRRRDARGAAASPRSASGRTGTRRTERGRRAATARRAARPSGFAPDLGQSPVPFSCRRALSCAAFAGMPPSGRRRSFSPCSRSRTCRSASVASSRSTGCRSSSRAGHIVGFIGPNGAGKTTMFNCLSRLYAFSDGRIAFEGRSLLETPRARHRRARHRPHVPEPGAVPDHERARERHARRPLRAPRTRLRRQRAAPAGGAARGSARSAAPVERLLALLDLERGRRRRRDGPAVRHAEARRARRARWRAEPKLLLLDEPAGGLNHEEVETLMELLRRIRAELDLTMLLVEHHMNMVMRVSDQRRRARLRPQDRRRHAGRGAGATRT